MKAIIFDACPGRPNAKQVWAAMSLGLPKGILWYPFAAALLLLLAIIAVGRYGLGIPTFIDRVFLRLNEWELVDRRAKRLCVWSERDAIIGMRDVKEHARLAGQQGVEVHVLEERETGICRRMSRIWRGIGALFGGCGKVLC